MVFAGRYSKKMAFDDPVVWVLIIAVVIFLFGANKIPQFAKSLGQARREFDQASKELTNPSPAPATPQTVTSGGILFDQPPAARAVPIGTTNAAPQSDALLLAAQKEGIDTQGKTREQVATELAWKLNRQASK
jgi:sec-independent protein translocase protein TatA